MAQLVWKEVSTWLQVWPFTTKAFSSASTRFSESPKDICILALLPSYLERSNSSLVYMTQKLMKQSGHPDNGFYLDRLTALSKVLKKNSENGG